MPSTSFHAWLSGGDFAAVLDMLRAWLQTDDFKIQDRLAGMEIVHDANGLYLFCHEGRPTSDSRPNFLMEGTIGASPEAAAERLRPLLQLSAARQIELSLEYVPIDENGQEIGDEISLR
jgi:hypothetical protein